MHVPPFPSLRKVFGTARSGQGRAGFARLCVPLTDSLRSAIWSSRERGRGLRGLPLAVFEAEPHARLQRAASPASPLSLSLSNRILLWMIPLLVDFLRALSPCFHPHSFGCLRCRCLLVFSFQGVLPSQCRTAGPQFPGSRRSAATSQSPQLGAFAYSADSQSFFSILSPPDCFPLPFPT